MGEALDPPPGRPFEMHCLKRNRLKKDCLKRTPPLSCWACYYTSFLYCASALLESRRMGELTFARGKMLLRSGFLGELLLQLLRFHQGLLNELLNEL